MRTITTDLTIAPSGLPPSVHLHQYDKGSASLVFLISDETGYYEIADGLSVYIRGTKPDKTGFSYACTYSGHTVTSDVYDQMTVCAGSYPAEIQIVGSDKSILGVYPFTMRITPAALADDTIVSKTDLPMVEKAAEAYDATKEAAASALVSERNAKASETNAASSATAAKTSETNAQASETNASNYAAATRQAKEDAVKAIDDETTAQKAVITSHANSAATTAGNTAVKAVTDQQETSVQAVKDQQTASVKAVNDSSAAAANSAKAAAASATESANSAAAAADSAKTAASIAGIGEFAFYIANDGLHFKFKQGGIS